MAAPTKVPLYLPTIIHNIYDRREGFTHSISIDGEEGLKVSYNSIARCGIFCAITPYYSEYFPEVFMITDFASMAEKHIHKSGYKKEISRI